MSDNEPDILNQLREELAAVTPSPAFAASVRTRVGAEDGARKSALAAWILPAAIAAATVIVVAIVRREAPLAPGADRPAVQSAPAIASSGPALAVAPSAAVTPSPTPSAVATARVKPIAADVAAEPKIEVITNQGSVLRRIWASVPGPVTERSETATEPAPPSEVRDLTVDPIQVEPIVVRSVDQPGPGSGSGTIIRRVAADATGSQR